METPMNDDKQPDRDSLAVLGEGAVQIQVSRNGAGDGATLSRQDQGSISSDGTRGIFNPRDRPEVRAEGSYPQLPTPVGETIACRVKWFCLEKAYGFLTRQDGGSDLFIGSNTVFAYGYGLAEMVPGRKIWVRVGRDGRGKQLAASIEGTLPDPEAEASAARANSPQFVARENGEEETGEGVVTYYSQTRGYGFVEVPGLDKAVFLHHSVVMAADRSWLAPGDRVVLRYGYGPKGYVATRLDQC